MAKKKKSKGKTVYRTRTNNVIQRIGGKAKKAGGVIAGLVAGAGGQLLNRFVPLGQWTQPAADLVTGYSMNNDTLMTLGGRSIGAMLASGINTGTQNSGQYGVLI